MKTNVRQRAVCVVAAGALLWALAFALCAWSARSALPGAQGPLADPTDFLAFYCGGKILAERRDPYRVEPLRSCEASALAESHLLMRPHFVVPAPLPPYALAFFSPFAAVSFRTACCAFLALSFVAVGAGIALVLRLSRIALPFVALALLVALGLGSLFIGQIVPLVLVALCASALALRSGRPRLAAGCALVTMLEPHMGLAVLLGLVVLERRARVPVALGVAALAALSLAAGGFSLNVAYLSQVLPAHARSEVANFNAQYSLTALLYARGAASDTALRAGEASYLAMLAFGLILAARLRRSFGDDAF
ncbi:MAG: DUF2029 domain-containing protein, partial [Candidatus Eremiobacteraeota bacterium]|nr:DUF2029 domain-containing protein [Candidatus Eremiobacteraeota bacterium]